MKKIIIIFFLLVTASLAQWHGEYDSSRVYQSGSEWLNIQDSSRHYQVDTSIIKVGVTKGGVFKQLGHRRLAGFIVRVAGGGEQDFAKVGFYTTEDQTTYGDEAVIKVDSSEVLSTLYYLADKNVYIGVDPTKFFGLRYIKPFIDEANETDEIVVYLLTVGL